MPRYTHFSILTMPLTPVVILLKLIVKLKYMETAM